MPRYVYYQPIFKNFTKFSLLFPRLQLLVSLSPFPVVWSGSIRFSGSLDHLLRACSWLSAFSPCVAFWIYLPGFCPLVSLVAGVEWCYPCWDPARFVHLHLSSLFISLLFILGLVSCWYYSL